MTLDALRLDVPELREEHGVVPADLAAQLARARQQDSAHALQQLLSLLFDLNRSPLTLLERQRALQSFSDEFRHYAALSDAAGPPGTQLLRLCGELAIGFKRLLLQMLQGRQPSLPHLAWCLYMAQHYLAQQLLRSYQLYQQPPESLWRDSHLLYWIGEQQQCLDEPIAAAFQPRPASSLRGLYQQCLLLALSDPFQLAEGECLTLFAALAPYAGLARLQPWDEDDDSEGMPVDLGAARPSLGFEQQAEGPAQRLRRFELGALLVALHEPAPLQSVQEHELLERVQPHWLGQRQRRHARAELDGQCSLVIGLTAIHAHLLEQRPPRSTAQILDAGSGGARLLCDAGDGLQMVVGQLVLLLTEAAPTLALVRWRHVNGEGLHLGLRYLKGLPRPVWLRRAPSAQTHPGVLQSTPAADSGWHHGLWLALGQFVEGEHLWLQLANVHNQAIVQLPASNLATTVVTRHPLRLN